MKGNNVFAVFKGYIRWDSKEKRWRDDEWLTQIYEQLRDAKDAIRQFAEGHPFDNDQENKVTRYFGEPKDIFDRGEELKKGDPGVVMHEWMRYAQFKLITAEDI